MKLIVIRLFQTKLIDLVICRVGPAFLFKSHFEFSDQILFSTCINILSFSCCYRAGVATAWLAHFAYKSNVQLVYVDTRLTVNIIVKDFLDKETRS